MSVTEGNLIPIQIAVRDEETGQRIDPTSLDAVVTDPTGAFIAYSYGVDPEITRQGVGDYTLTWRGTPHGRWFWFTQTMGHAEGTGQGYVDVDPLQSETASTSYRPTVDEVAERLYARTLDQNGNRGEFGPETSPNNWQVDALITDALALVQAAIGSDLADNLTAAAKYAVICRTAMSIERGFYPEATTTDDSGYSAWADEYTAAIAAVTTALNQDQPNQQRVFSLPISTLVRPGAGVIDPWCNDLMA